MSIKVYLDNCCFNRPYDDQRNLKIELETKAKLKIQELIVDGELEIVTSYILELENDDNPFLERKMVIEDFFRYAKVGIGETPEILEIANSARKTGLKTKDSLHVACAIITNCDYLITTDKRLIKYNDDRIKIVNPVEFILEMEEESL